MARIPYLDLALAPPEFAELLAKRPPLNVYRMIAHGGHTATGFLALGSAILGKSTLDPKLRELAILRVGALSGAKYEVFQHRRVAARAGVPAEKIEAVLLAGEPDAGVFDAFEVALLRFTDAVVRQVKAPDELFAAVAKALSHQQLVELLITVGFYMLVSRLLENLEVDIEDPPLH